MENYSPEDIDNNNLFYNDNYVPNYEEMACCNNSVITTFLQEKGIANIINYINDLCFNNDPMDEDAQIINDPKQKVKTPLCSHNKRSSSINFDNNIIDNKNNNKNNQMNNSFLSNAVNNPSNDSAAEPIVSNKKCNEYFNQHESQNQKKNKKFNDFSKNNTNILDAIKDIFKVLFTEKKEDDQNEDNKSDNGIKINLKKKLNFNEVIESAKTPEFQPNQNHQRNKENNNILKHANSQIFKRPQLFADNILSFNISEGNHDEALTKLVSIIPIFTVKKKNKSNADNNKCTICLSDFEVGDKKSTLPCLHCFHSHCIERWMKRQKYCPICKIEILESLKSSIDPNYK